MIWLRYQSSSLVVLGILVLGGCSIRQTAVNLIGDALSGGGGVYASDDDPDLVREALPFGLKMFESLLEVSPNHRGLLLAAARGFTSYAFLIQNEADRLDEKDFRQARQLRARARGLYLRGRDFALRGLETYHPGFTRELRKDHDTTLRSTSLEDVPYLYWAGASWGGAISVAKNDPDLLINLPLAGALVARVLELDETYDFGAAHEFFISFEASRPGGSTQTARKHYRRALEISGGQRASTHLAIAEAVSIREQKLDEFKTLMATALSVETDKNPDLRLTNTIAKARAAWLQTRINELFLDAETSEENKK